LYLSPAAPHLRSPDAIQNLGLSLPCGPFMQRSPNAMNLQFLSFDYQKPAYAHEFPVEISSTRALACAHAHVRLRAHVRAPGHERTHVRTSARMCARACKRARTLVRTCAHMRTFLLPAKGCIVSPTSPPLPSDTNLHPHSKNSSLTRRGDTSVPVVYW
jgi:hypothetical protein